MKKAYIFYRLNEHTESWYNAYMSAYVCTNAHYKVVNNRNDNN